MERRRLEFWIPPIDPLLSKIDIVVASAELAFDKNLVTRADIDIHRDGLFTFDEAVVRRRAELRAYRKILKYIQNMLVDALRKANASFTETSMFLDSRILEKEEELKRLNAGGQRSTLRMEDMINARLSQRICELEAERNDLTAKIRDIDSQVSSFPHIDGKASERKVIEREIRHKKKRIRRANDEHDRFVRETRNKLSLVMIPDEAKTDSSMLELKDALTRSLSRLREQLTRIDSCQRQVEVDIAQTKSLQREMHEEVLDIKRCETETIKAASRRRLSQTNIVQNMRAFIEVKKERSGVNVTLRQRKMEHLVLIDKVETLQSKIRGLRHKKRKMIRHADRVSKRMLREMFRLHEKETQQQTTISEAATNVQDSETVTIHVQSERDDMTTAHRSHGIERLERKLAQVRSDNFSLTERVSDLTTQVELLKDTARVQSEWREKRSTILDLCDRIEDAKSRVMELRQNISKKREKSLSDRETISVHLVNFHQPSDMSQAELSMIDLLSRVKLEKKRWTEGLHPSSIALLVNSWTRQLDEVSPSFETLP